MPEIKFLGAGKEIGRSCIELIYSNKTRLLLDCGIKIKQDSNEYPLGLKNLDEIDLAFLSHPHLDHIGAFPFICSRGFKAEVITTNLSREIGAIMLNDCFNIERKKTHPPSYAKRWINRSVSMMVEKKEGEIKGIKYKLIPSGHVPGSVSVYLEGNGFASVLYTSDINGTETRLMPKHNPLPHVDILIVDSTYGNRRHPSRRRVEKKFKKKVLETLKRGGSVVIPSFSMARAQEILLILNDIKKFPCPIYVDGMAVSITNIYLRFLSMLKDKKLRKALSKVILVRNQEMRKHIVKKQGIFISSSGMLAPSCATFYVNHFFNCSKSSILFTGYQAEKTPGRKLLDNHLWNFYGQDEEVKSDIDIFSFSAHADYRDIKKIIKEVNPRYVVAQHGDQGISSVISLAQELDKIALAPVNGESLNFH